MEGEAVVILPDVDEKEVNLSLKLFSLSFILKPKVFHKYKTQCLQVASLVSFVTLGQNAPPPLNLQPFLQCPPWMAKYTELPAAKNGAFVEIEHFNKGGQPAGVEDMSDMGEQLGMPRFEEEDGHKIDSENVCNDVEPDFHIFPCIGCSDRFCADILLQNTNGVAPEISTVKHEGTEEEAKTFNCKKCDQVFSVKKMLQKHVREHRCGVTHSFSCPNCDFTSLTIENIHKHKKKHRKRKRCCSHCGFTSKEKTEFQTHKKEHGKKKLFAPKEKAINPVIRKYACETCSYKASQKVQLNVHLTLVHNVENLVKNIFQCKQCPRRLLSSHKLEDHMKLHAPPSLPCQHCGKMFHTDQHLSKHNYAVHTPDDEKQLRCKECGKGFISPSRMREHMNIHLGVKPHMCPHCGKHLSNVSNLQAHTRKLHPEHFKEGGKKSVRVM